MSLLKIPSSIITSLLIFYATWESFILIQHTSFYLILICGLAVIHNYLFHSRKFLWKPYDNSLGYSQWLTQCNCDSFILSYRMDDGEWYFRRTSEFVVFFWNSILCRIRHRIPYTIDDLVACAGKRKCHYGKKHLFTHVPLFDRVSPSCMFLLFGTNNSNRRIHLWFISTFVGRMYTKSRNE